MAKIIQVPKRGGTGFHWINVDAIEFINEGTDPGECTVHTRSGPPIFVGCGAGVLAQHINEDKTRVL